MTYGLATVSTGGREQAVLVAGERFVPLSHWGEQRDLPALLRDWQAVPAQLRAWAADESAFATGGDFSAADVRMPIELNETHDPARRSWVESANAEGTDFPIQNLPFGVFDDGKGARGGVALGDWVVDLAVLLEAGAISGPAAAAASGRSLLALFACAQRDVSALRAALSDLYRADGTGDRRAAEAALVPMNAAELLLPAKPTAFTDFCTSADHILRMLMSQVRVLAVPSAAGP